MSSTRFFTGRSLLAVAVSLASHNTLASHIEEVVVRGVHDTRTIEVSEALVASPDAAQLLKRAATEQ